jgi:hypothetical protein
MRTRILRLTTITCVLIASAAAANAEVCLTIDTARDAFSPSDQAAALLLVTRQLEQEGERVVPADCARPYTLSHVRLGDTIVVHIAGREGQREAIAHGMEDLPALYSQMARSIVTGRPMTGFNVVDRTNVTASQATARRLHTDSVWYARLGYGILFGNDPYATPALGFGYRAELDSFAIDVAFLNFQFSAADSSSSSGGTAQTLLKLSGLYFLSPSEPFRIPRWGTELWASELRRVVQPCDWILHIQLGRQRYAGGAQRWIRARARDERQSLHASRRRASFSTNQRLKRLPAARKGSHHHTNG